MGRRMQADTSHFMIVMGKLLTILMFMFDFVVVFLTKIQGPLRGEGILRILLHVPKVLSMYF